MVYSKLKYVLVFLWRMFVVILPNIQMQVNL